MSFAEARTRQQAAVFDRLGEDAGWTGVADPVRIRLRRYDGEAGLGDGDLIVRRVFIRVRASDVPRPASGDEVTPSETGGTFVVRGDPMLDQKNVWECEAVEQ